MAKPDAKAAETTGAAPPAKKKKLLIIVVALVLVLAIAGGGAFFLLKSKKNPDEHAEDEESTEVKKKDDKKKEAHPPVFLTLDSFTVNLVKEASNDQYLQVALSVELEDSAAETALKANMPRVKNAITMLLSDKKASELLPKEGKEKLANELKDAINEILEPAPPKKAKKGDKAKAAAEGPTKAVLFTSFIIQ